MEKILTIGDYWIWQGYEGDTKRYYFNVSKPYAAPMASGYYNLKELLKTKGITNGHEA